VPAAPLNRLWTPAILMVSNWAFLFGLAAYRAGAEYVGCCATNNPPVKGGSQVYKRPFCHRWGTSSMPVVLLCLQECFEETRGTSVDQSSGRTGIPQLTKTFEAYG
jgi:hypothetical protein